MTKDQPFVGSIYKNGYSLFRAEGRETHRSPNGAEGWPSDQKSLSMDFYIPNIYRNFVVDNYVMKKLLFLVFVLLFSGILKAQEQQVVVPYTLADRDRTIRLEAKMEAIDAKMEALEIKMDAQESKMDVKFEAVNARIDYLFWLQGVIVALILFMLGYMIWDRRTALQPALAQSVS